MHKARMAVRGVIGLVIGAALAGCFSATKSPTLPTLYRPQASFEPVPELRIPANALAAAPEIPLVPLPIPPSGTAKPARAEAPPKAATPPVVPALEPPNGKAPVAVPAASTGNEPEPPGAASAKTKTTVPAGPVASSDNSLRSLQQLAAARYATIDSYIVRLTRREMVRGRDKPEEIILFKFRKDPWSVHFKWIGPEGQGREVVYVKGQLDNKMNTLLAAGDIPLTPAGKRLALPVDSLLVRSNSRHLITEAGIGNIIERFGMRLDALERGDKRQGTFNDLGLQSRPEFARPAHCVEQMIPAGAESDLPNGGRRYCWYDADNNLPLLLVTRDDKGKEVEYYHYAHLLYPVNLDAQDFNPDKLWGPPMSPKP